MAEMAKSCMKYSPGVQVPSVELAAFAASKICLSVFSSISSTLLVSSTSRSSGEMVVDWGKVAAVEAIEAFVLVGTTLPLGRAIGAPGGKVGDAAGIGACGGGGACLFFLRLSTDTFAALSSTPLSRGDDGVVEMEVLRWMRNCSAMSLSSFLRVCW